MCIENVCSNHISELCYNTVTVYNVRGRCAYWQQYIENFKILKTARSHSDTPHSVVFLWASNQIDAETST